MFIVLYVVGMIEDLRRFYHYFSQTATLKQEINNMVVAIHGLEPWTTNSTRLEHNKDNTASPIMI